MNKKVRLLSKILLLPFLLSTINPVTCLSMNKEKGEIAAFDTICYNKAMIDLRKMTGTGEDKMKSWIKYRPNYLLKTNEALKQYVNNSINFLQLQEKKQTETKRDKICSECIEESLKNNERRYFIEHKKINIDKFKSQLLNILKEVYNIMGLNNSSDLQIYKPCSYKNNLYSFKSASSLLIKELISIYGDFFNDYRKYLKSKKNKKFVYNEKRYKNNSSGYLKQHADWHKQIKEYGMEYETWKIIAEHCKKVHGYLKEILSCLVKSVNGQECECEIQYGDNVMDITITKSSQKV